MPCPACGSPDPGQHPAVQAGGEVQICADAFHVPPRIGDHTALPPAYDGEPASVVARMCALGWSIISHRTSLKSVWMLIDQNGVVRGIQDTAVWFKNLRDCQADYYAEGGNHLDFDSMVALAQEGRCPAAQINLTRPLPDHMGDDWKPATPEQET